MPGQLNISYSQFSDLFPSGQPGAVLWDMDGVLCDTMELHFSALRMACASLRYAFPEEIMTLGIGRSDRDNAAYILAQNGMNARSGEIGDQVAILQNEKENLFCGLLEEKPLSANAGVRPWLSALRARRIPCAVASSSPIKAIQIILRKIDLIGYFAAIISGAELKKSKPDPEVFLRAAGALRASPEACLVIEDAPSGVEAALTAGMKCLAIGASVPLEKLSKADIVVPSLAFYSPEIAFGV